MKKSSIIALGILTGRCLAAVEAAQDSAPLAADRAATERVYYTHRTGTKQPFEQAMPRELLEKLVRQDLHKEVVLKKVYGVEISTAQITAEVQRINATTRAPEMLAELKAALGNDPARFARTVARPILAERILRQRFENDDQLHAAVRRQAEKSRDEMLSLRQSDADAERLAAALKDRGGNSFHETTWQLTSRPAEDKPASPALQPGTAVQTKATSDQYTLEATVQVAQVLSAPRQKEPGHAQKYYFEDLPPELQNVLRVQLRAPGDISAVIETPQGFLLYVAKAVTPETLSAASFNLPKRSYEEWLAEQVTEFNPRTFSSKQSLEKQP